MPNSTGKRSVSRSTMSAKSHHHMTTNTLPHYGLPPKSATKPQRREKSPVETLSSLESAHSASSFGGPIPTSQFEMMDITVSVNLLEGLVMKNKSLLSESPNHIQKPLPINAVISFLKNVSSSQSIATHLPSLPIGSSSASDGKKEQNFMARWPVDFDPNGDALSTFKFSRLMRKEFVPSDHPSAAHNELKLGFVAEEIELVVSLMQGSEMLTLGKANLVVTGEERDEMVIDLPVQRTKINQEKENREMMRQRSPSPFRRSASPFRRTSSSKPMQKNSKAQKLKSVSFSSEPKRKYKLSEHAIVRVQVQVSPQCDTAQYDIEQEPNENFCNHNTRYDHGFERKQSMQSTISKFDAMGMEEKLTRKGTSRSKMSSKPPTYIHDPPPTSTVIASHYNPTINTSKESWSSPEPVLQTLNSSSGSRNNSIPNTITPRIENQRVTSHKYSNRAQSKDAYLRKRQTQSGYHNRKKVENNNDGALASRPTVHQAPSPSEKVANWLFNLGGEEELANKEKAIRQKNLHHQYVTETNKRDQLRYKYPASDDDSDEDESSDDSSDSSDDDSYDRLAHQPQVRRGRSRNRRLEL